MVTGFGYGPHLMLSNAQQSAGAHAQNPVGWRCGRHNENPSRLDVGSAAGAVLGFAELVACKRSLNVRTQRAAQPSAGAMGWADGARSSSVILACIHDGSSAEEQHQGWLEYMEETIAAARAPDGRFSTE